jgi:hypothetical protein
MVCRDASAQRDRLSAERIGTRIVTVFAGLLLLIVADGVEVACRHRLQEAAPITFGRRTTKTADAARVCAARSGRRWYA